MVDIWNVLVTASDPTAQTIPLLRFSYALTHQMSTLHIAGI